MNISKIIKILIISIFILIIQINNSDASSWDINLVVSPIKYELTGNPGESIVKNAKIINKSDQQKFITTWKANFSSDNSTWNPIFIKDNLTTNLNTELASWITVNTPSFTINPGEEKNISFTINIPSNATPGWHYWAVFFKYKWTNQSWKITIDADYGVLVLLTVSWEIINDWSPGDTNITTWWGINTDLNTYTNSLEDEIDDCIIDLTDSNTDWKCIDVEEAEEYIEDITDLNSADDNEENTSEDNSEDNSDNNSEEKPEITFEIPFNNKWNTHIKPKWKIVIQDENWNIIKSIWKKQIVDNNGTIIWEQITDYININESDWNVLPETKRIFKAPWKWFFEPSIDKDWKNVIKYISPEEYFSKENSIWRVNLYPWERICEKRETKNLKAIITTGYESYDWEDIEFNSAKDFKVVYTKKYIWLNPYFFIMLSAIILALILFFLLILRLRTRKCKHCKKRVKKNMKICPYCGKKIKNKK